MPVAEAFTRTGTRAFAQARASRWVGSILEARRRWRRLELQGASAMFAPHRFTTASTPSREDVSSRPSSGSQRISSECAERAADEDEHAIAAIPQVG
jgi:hypothetical protein